MPATECTNSVSTLSISSEFSVVADDITVRDGSSSLDPGIADTRLIEFGFLGRLQPSAHECFIEVTLTIYMYHLLI
ncbi:hypothetical protein GUJ93_ZPchr0008g12373 [Zizania palustris]|uniref:Uncharacterized protein n=1 Tax=Zizania palustris TaxID=103762 RepID=A0A8J5RI53_ZIZPA|nr:hypothetical protein GUJ93_ZPchr0008g12373 [Zizania palustris]